MTRVANLYSDVKDGCIIALRYRNEWRLGLLLFIDGFAANCAARKNVISEKKKENLKEKLAVAGLRWLMVAQENTTRCVGGTRTLKKVIWRKHSGRGA